MSSRLVCDIYFYLYIRFLLGFYHKFERSEPVRWLAWCYCFLFCTNIVFGLYNVFNNEYSPCPIILTCIEYVLYVLISFWKNNKYLLRYYKRSQLLDDVKANTYKSMRFYFMGYITALILLKLFDFMKLLVFHWSITSDRLFFAILEFSTWCTNVVGRSPVLFVFALLYTRVSSMRKMMENNDFQCRSQGKHHPRQYVQMYEAILDGLENDDIAVKLQLFVSIVFSSLFFTFEALYNLYLTKSIYKDGTVFDIIWFVVEIVARVSPLVASAVLSDMVYMEVQKMLVITLKRRIECKNERDRAEIQKLVQLLKDRPFQYSLWRIIPLNLRCVLSVLSYCITSVIAIVQIKEWFK